MVTDPEYGVYERLAVLETEISILKRALNGGLPPSKHPLSEPLYWVLIAATAFGNGPEVMKFLATVFVK
jgi:hypothetical protein